MITKRCGRKLRAPGRHNTKKRPDDSLGKSHPADRINPFLLAIPLQVHSGRIPHDSLLMQLIPSVAIRTPSNNFFILKLCHAVKPKASTAPCFRCFLSNREFNKTLPWVQTTTPLTVRGSLYHAAIRTSRPSRSRIASTNSSNNRMSNAERAADSG